VCEYSWWQRRVCAIFHLGRKSCRQCLTFVFGLPAKPVVCVTICVCLCVCGCVNAYFCTLWACRCELRMCLCLCVNLRCSHCCLQFLPLTGEAAFSFNLWRIFRHTSFFFFFFNIFLLRFASGQRAVSVSQVAVTAQLI